MVMLKNPIMGKNDMVLRRRITGQEFRAADVDGDKSISGHPAVFDSPADIGGYFQEIIQRGAFDGCDMTDVLLFVNHNQGKVPLARSRRNNGNSTMTLSVDDKGLKMDARLDCENNADAKKVYSAISRGDMDGMSFCFRIAEQKWTGLDGDYPTRYISKIAKVYEVSAVNEPAYENTDIYARDKTALESARQAVDTARDQLESRDEIDIYKWKNKILGGM